MSIVQFYWFGALLAHPFLYSDTCQLQQLRNFCFPTQSHNMHALAVGPALPNDLGGDLHTGDAGLCPLFVSGQRIDHMLGYVDTGNAVVAIKSNFLSKFVYGKAFYTPC